MSAKPGHSRTVRLEVKTPPFWFGRRWAVAHFECPLLDGGPLPPPSDSSPPQGEAWLPAGAHSDPVRVAQNEALYRLWRAKEEEETHLFRSPRPETVAERARLEFLLKSVGRDPDKEPRP